MIYVLLTFLFNLKFNRLCFNRLRSSMVKKADDVFHKSTSFYEVKFNFAKLNQQGGFF